eukprot:4899095-Pleurochrysis_carterae.AAC.2
MAAELRHAAPTKDSGTEAAFAIVSAIGAVLILAIETFHRITDYSYMTTCALVLPFYVCYVAYILRRWLTCKPAKRVPRLHVLISSCNAAYMLYRPVSSTPILPLACRWLTCFCILLFLWLSLVHSQRHPGSRWSLPALAQAAAIFDTAGMELVFVTLKGGEAPVDKNSADSSNMTQRAFWMQFEHKTMTTLKLNRCPAKDFAAIFICNGPTVPSELGTNEVLHSTMRNLYEAGGVIGGVGLGLTPIAELRLSDGSYLVSGRQASGCAGSSKAQHECHALLLRHGACVHRGGGGHEALSSDRYAISGRVFTGADDGAALAVAAGMTRALAALKKI